ncbi:MAG TPA: type II toxin-antitoxin system VapC family toxin [Thermoanaerobaculia bacterium]|nr:type II toxin-antitoxin system VapC family toxin [Thermoanaerobaculia bacterium]
MECLFRTRRGITLAPEIEKRGIDLHVPAFANIEFASAVARLLMRRIVTIDRATEALGDLVDLPLTRHGHLALLPRILSLRGNFSVYDGVYVALAESLAADLITADDKLIGAVGARD